MVNTDAVKKGMLFPSPHPLRPKALLVSRQMPPGLKGGRSIFYPSKACSVLPGWVKEGEGKEEKQGSEEPEGEIRVRSTL